MDHLDALARLDQRLQNLERRVSALEHSSQPGAPLLVEATTPVKRVLATDEFAFPKAGGLFPVVGKAILGIAGAYVLRAIAESGSVPILAIIVLSLGYAGAWLVGAKRVPSGTRFASTTYAATAALILAPMLGELTLRFHVLPAFATASLLSVFVGAAFAMSWKQNLVQVVWVATVTTVLTALTLLIASHDLVPYTAVLLFVALISEAAGASKRWQDLRFLVAPASDIAVWILIYIHSMPESSRSEYSSLNTFTKLAIPSALFWIYGAGITHRIAFLRQRITVFQIAQVVLTFVLAAVSWSWFASGAGRAALGIFCWLLASICYGAAFLYFNPDAEQRNYHVYATWGMALLLAGSSLMLPPLSLSLFLSSAALVATLVGVRMERLTLEFHGLICVAVAAFTSGLLEYAGRTLAGSFPPSPGWILWIVAVSTLLCYAIGTRLEGNHRHYQLFRLLSAILAVVGVAPFLISGLVRLVAAGMTLSASHVAMIRTFTTCVLALALAFSGSRWERIELIWSAYGALVYVTAKLLFEDLPHGHSGAIAVSLFLYAATLIIVPRVARPGRKHT